jgi:hypothetical protein
MAVGVIMGVLVRLLFRLARCPACLLFRGVVRLVL